MKMTQVLEWTVIWKRADAECEFILADVSVHWVAQIAITWGISSQLTFSGICGVVPCSRRALLVAFCAGDDYVQRK